MVPMAPSSTSMRSRIAAARRSRVLGFTLSDIGLATVRSLFPLPVGERVRVRGILIRRCGDDFQNTVDILHDVVVPEPQDEITELLQFGGSLRIFDLSFRMLPAIEFD